MQKTWKSAALAAALMFSMSAFAGDKVLNKDNPDGYQQFKMDYADMVEVANPNVLAWRMFYVKPSTGPDAKWFDAVKRGDLELVKQMVKEGQNIEAKDEDSLGQTALGWAAFIGYEDMVDYLLEQNADLFATDRGDVSNALKSAGLGANVDIFKTAPQGQGRSERPEKRSPGRDHSDRGLQQWPGRYRGIPAGKRCQP